MRNAPIRQTVELPTFSAAKTNDDKTDDAIVTRYRQALRKQTVQLRKQEEKVAELEAKNKVKMENERRAKFEEQPR